MADKRNRRWFTPKFKEQAAKRVLEGRSVSEVATELGLSTWRTKHLAAGSAELLVRRRAEEAEMQRLPTTRKQAPRGGNHMLRKTAALRQGDHEPIRLRVG